MHPNGRRGSAGPPWADPGGRRAAELAQDGAGQLAVKDDVSKPAIWTPNEPSGGRHN